MALNGSPDQEHAWPLVITGASDINTDPSYNRTLAPRLQQGPGCYHGFRWQCRPLQISMFPMATWPSEIHMVSSGSPNRGYPMAFAGNSGHRHPHRSQLQQDHGPRHGPWQQPRQARTSHGLRQLCGLLVSACSSLPSSPQSSFLLAKVYEPLASLSLPPLHRVLHLSHTFTFL